MMDVGCPSCKSGGIDYFIKVCVNRYRSRDRCVNTEGGPKSWPRVFIEQFAIFPERAWSDRGGKIFCQDNRNFSWGMAPSSASFFSSPVLHGSRRQCRGV